MISNGTDAALSICDPRTVALPGPSAGTGGPGLKRTLAERIRVELLIHTMIEDDVFQPARALHREMPGDVPYGGHELLISPEAAQGPTRPFTRRGPPHAPPID